MSAAIDVAELPLRLPPLPGPAKLDRHRTRGTGNNERHTPAAIVAPDGTKTSPTQGQTFFYYGKNVAVFAEAFGPPGFCRCMR